MVYAPYYERPATTRTGVTKTTVYVIESGCGPVRPSTRRNLAEALGAPSATVSCPLASKGSKAAGEGA